MAPTLPDRSVLRDAYLQLEAATRRLRTAYTLIGTSHPDLIVERDRDAARLISEAKSLLHAAEARLR